MRSAASQLIRQISFPQSKAQHGREKFVYIFARGTEETSANRSRSNLCDKKNAGTLGEQFLVQKLKMHAKHFAALLEDVRFGGASTGSEKVGVVRVPRIQLTGA